MRRTALYLVPAILLLSSFNLISYTFAAVFSCSASVSPSSVNRNTTNDFSFTVNNTDTVTYNWIKITRPSAAIWTINSGSASGWSASADANDVTFTGGTIGVGSSGSFTVNATTADFTADSTAWTVEVSDSGGGGAFGCSGSLGTSVTNPSSSTAPSTSSSPLSITGLSANNITSSSTTIVWTTDIAADSRVEYGLEEGDWLSSVSDSSFVASHSITLSGLNASTTYYYEVTTITPSGSGANVGGNSFTTAAPGGTAASQSATNTTTTTTTASKKDSTAPTLSLSTNLSRGYVTAPTIFGTATDDSGVSEVEYSIDGGGSWIAASVKGKGEKQVTFSFSLGVLDDGNYTFLIRAKDSAGNVSETKSYTLIIDRLPPQVGAAIFSAGAQVFAPTKEGIMVVVAGLEQKITLSAVGGPTTLEISAGDENLPAARLPDGQGRQEFNLTKNPESGLWSGTIKFDNPGLNELTSKSVDGAKNETIQKLAKVSVLEPGKVSYLGKPAPGAEISVYVFEPTLGQFILWDGVSYGQQNPQKTNENGNYSLLLPAGRYYIEARLSGFIKLRTQIFELSAPSPINADLSVGFLSIPFIANEIKIDPIKDFPPDIKIENELVGKDFPLELVSGKPQVVSFAATWLPDTAEQIKILESLEGEEFRATVIVSQESKSSVEIYKKRGRYAIEMLADPDGKLVEPLALRFLPTHFFLDKDAKIKIIKFGVLSKEELLENIK